MPLHCATTRSEFLNVYFYFSNPVTCLGDILENRTYITIFNDFFDFYRLLSSTLVSTSNCVTKYSHYYSAEKGLPKKALHDIRKIAEFPGSKILTALVCKYYICRKK